ncbi:MAG: RNA polymerase sigma factor, partial [Anaerolinea sp.]|nr:RNA polymerase sigma factor [Anaerolinea sp.]
ILLTACRDSGSDRQERAFEELWHWLYPRVYARVNHPQDAEDVAQKILVKVYQNLHQVREPHGFLGWVSIIMQRELIDYYRRKGRHDQFEEEKPEENGDNGDVDGMGDLVGPDSFLQADVEAAEEELIRMIYECMPKKKWRRAEVLVALTLLEQTVTEVAESMKITANAVYSLYFQAKRDLPKHCPELIEYLLQQLMPSQRLGLKEGNS